MPSASSLFLLSFCFRNLLLEIFSELAENLLGIFICHDEVPVRRRAGGEAHRAEAPPAVAQGEPIGGARPCPWDLTSTPSDGYKLLSDLKTSRWPLFSRNSTTTRRHRKPKFGVQFEADPGTLPEGRSISEGSSSHAFLWDEL